MAMADKEDPAIVYVANPSHLMKIKPAKDFSINGLDFISSLPDDILHRILSFIPTNFTITTSVLSKRWRHVWSHTHCLFFERFKASYESINKTLASWSDVKIMSFHLETTIGEETQLVNSMIEFAISRKVEKLTVKFDFPIYKDNSFADCFFNNPCTSLKSLSLRLIKFSSEPFLKIISACPMLESLTLDYCEYSFQYLDLSKLLRLTRLDIDCMMMVPMQIRAPHIRYLRLRNSERLCTLVDVSSLIEADLDIWHFCWWNWDRKDLSETDSLQVLVQTMLDKLQNVKKLTVGMDFLHVLSLSELSGVPLPTLMVETLILETKLTRSVVPGIARLVQSSPGLKKITVYTIPYTTALDKCVNRCFESKEMNPNQSWRSEVVAFPTELSDCEVVEPKLVDLLMELLMAKSRTLETLVVYRSGASGKRFQIARNNNNN